MFFISNIIIYIKFVYTVYKHIIDKQFNLSRITYRFGPMNGDWTLDLAGLIINMMFCLVKIVLKIKSTYA